jgi:hypothetical protein
MRAILAKDRFRQKSAENRIFSLCKLQLSIRLFHWIPRKNGRNWHYIYYAKLAISKTWGELWGPDHAWMHDTSKNVFTSTPRMDEKWNEPHLKRSTRDAFIRKFGETNLGSFLGKEDWIFYFLGGGMKRIEYEWESLFYFLSMVSSPEKRVLLS